MTKASTIRKQGTMPASTINTAASQRLLSPMIGPACRNWIAGVVALFVVSPTDIGLFERIVVLAVYGVLFAYPLLYRLWPMRPSRQFISYQSPRMPLLLAVLAVQFVGVTVSTAYYTGTDIFSAYGEAFSGANTYADYQRHFSERAIANASLFAKALYIGLLAISKLATIFFIANFFLSLKRTSTLLLMMALSTAIYLGFGLARGTFFEVFELAAAYAYFWAITSNFQSLKGRLKQSKVFKFVLIAGPIALVSLFIANALRRYDDTSAFFSQCSPNFCFSSYGMPFSIEYPLYLLTVYFGNGAYFMAKLYEATIYAGEWSYLLPLQSVFSGDGGDFGVRNFMCGTYVQCKFVWTPEVVTLISIFGIAAIPIVNFIFYLAQRFESWAFKDPSIVKMISLYFVFLFLLSLPVANFLLVSSSSVVSLVMLSGLLALNARKPRSTARQRA